MNNSFGAGGGFNSTGAFGAKPAGSFGQTNQTGAGFGATSGFGTTTGFGTTGQTGTGFGATTGFGGATSGFGTNTSSFGGFGQTQNKTNAFGFGATPQVQKVAVLKPDSLFNRVWNLRCAYNPDSPAYRFCYIFYNKKHGQNFPECPKNITEADWVKICMECPDPDHLVPYPLMGFDALKERAASQKEMKDKLVERMKIIQAKLREMTSFYATELQGSFERIQQNATTIQQSMLEVIETEEVQHQQGRPMTDAENAMLAKLENMQLDLNRPGMYHAAIHNLRVKTQENPSKGGSHLTIDKESLTAMATVLKANQDAIEALEKVTKKVAKTVATVEAEMSEQV
ncbi:hypothetical protein TRFO_13830 [Tritrichomonas foetus]|uniref:Nucleoporin Nup54 alpha-helical domain-containing protein n=1 Tax=Tritrichomonas foetus TaxID=1144522 RepID=A0A1J4KXA6_9EUKA|nr:hypothetical protein TRFO_13830 [Tritrichomonas foetus]|eukprot:OHT15810.1 hypothetical protein TRFO_13830 [Tritrichomonas foetus]